VEIERHKLERAAHDKAIALISILACSAVMLIGVTMLLLGLAYWIEPSLGTGPAFTIIGAAVALCAGVGALVVNAASKSSSEDL